ncbi:hypothetical protein CEXT_774411 [Caerostris extrusa]|uniref:Uncharacterized protein n=1 Tax=Caerostris extrusa TaxID=172846 RepID=A0AAV4X5E7_CAEEX|nr:hypothetical protein CEXT_774411 [Caerostris extrusa]
MKEVGDDVFSHPYHSGVFLASPGDAFALWMIPVSSYKQRKVLFSTVENGKMENPITGACKRLPGRIAAQQEPKHSDAWH